MSLAESISDSLGGKRSGKGFRVPAVCHNSDSKHHNLYLADADDGKLIAVCYSCGCGWQSIMATLEELGLKPRNEFTPEAQAQHKAYKTKQNKLALLKAIAHESFVLNRYIDMRLEDHYRSVDRTYMKLHPEHKPMPDELWGRETEAAQKLKSLIGAYLHEYES